MLQHVGLRFGQFTVESASSTRLSEARIMHVYTLRLKLDIHTFPPYTQREEDIDFSVCCIPFSKLDGADNPPEYKQ